MDRFVSSPLVRRATEAILLGLLLVQVAVVALKTDFYQYDFRAYYLGPRLLWSDQDPYSMAALTERAEALGLADNNHPFIYAPYMLLVFGAIAWLPYKLAYWLWLTFQVAICVAIFRLTKRRLGVSATMLMFLGALGLNGTTAACLRAGQLSLLLTLLVLLAITSLLDRKPGHSSAFVFVAAAIKLWPISFGGLGCSASAEGGSRGWLRFWAWVFFWLRARPSCPSFGADLVKQFEACRASGTLRRVLRTVRY